MQATSSLAYLEDYLDTFEALPLELTRQLTLLKELDSKSFRPMEQAANDAPHFLSTYETLDPAERESEAKKLNDLFTTLIQHGKEKVKMATSIYDLVERHIRRLDEDLVKFEEEQMTGPRFIPKHDYSKFEKLQPSRSTRRDSTPKKRKNQDDVFHENTEYKETSSPVKASTPNSRVSARERKTISSRLPAAVSKPLTEPEPVDEPEEADLDVDDQDADANEPTYCICDRVSYGEMIACDNDDCAREWFHVSCVGLSGPVKGKWFCPDCEELMKLSLK